MSPTGSCGGSSTRRRSIWANSAPTRPSKTDDNLSKYLPTFEPRKAALELSQRHLGIDHRQQASRHFGEAFADVAHRGAERADDAILLLEELHQVDRGGWS